VPEVVVVKDIKMYKEQAVVEQEVIELSYPSPAGTRFS
jgi:hypothetical protein